MKFRVGQITDTLWQVQGKDDEESRGYVVGLSMTAAILGDELGFSTLASSYKNEAEGLLVRQPGLGAFVPAVSEAERRRYEGIRSAVSRKMPTVVADANPHRRPRFRAEC